MSPTDDTPRGLSFTRLANGGMILTGDAPSRAIVPTSVVNRAVAEGWATLDTPTMQQKDFVTGEGSYLFTEANAIVFHFADDEDVRYNVIHQPGIHGDSVDWFYVADLEE
jgi:hypothetical protein